LPFISKKYGIKLKKTPRVHIISKPFGVPVIALMLKK
jgi:hypothetical protein